ncbi:hypothetical protein GCM10007298_38130 [Williamsia phyllosphaerae]|uniref:Uncharacterized protein n=1 Tax=Williamsia phyllosphaerae TaxID=885042 RepID=A0ABQ1V712_9NOCA|nr:hypothetical protein GCM10007298_38130 [Williamsia phyllosphaerae]
MIGVLADVLDDLEKVRIANANRVRVLTKTEADDDGEMRGFGLTADHPEVKKLIMTVEAMGAAEHDAILNLQRALRKHPFNAFQKRYRGLGEKQFARLIATIGDPYWNDLHERPRTVSELWAYTGFHVVKSSGSHYALGAHKSNAAGSTSTPAATDPVNRQRSSAAGVAPKRQRGQQSNWSEDARKRAWVIAASLIKGGRMVDDKRGPQDPIADHYRVVYDEAKRKYAGSLHPAVCVRCGPAGKPAQVGSPRSDAHVHAMALRLVSKTLLKDLWLEARDLYAQNGWQ